MRYLMLAVLMLGTGCATTSSVDALRNDIAGLRSDVQQASMDAQEARRQAEEANARSRTTEEMLNRGFKRSMYK